MLSPPASAQQRGTIDHSATVTAGAGGSVVLGNPSAPRIVEYVSYTCPHCATFANEAGATLRTNYVATGRASVEVRHIVRDPVDLAMTVAAHCGAANRFYSRHTALMAQQSAILARASALTQAQVTAWSQGTAPQRLRRVADDVGVTQWMRARGFTAAQINGCFADTAMHERLVAMSNSGLAAGVQGTPSFALNGRLLANVHNWAALRPALDSALASR